PISGLNSENLDLLLQAIFSLLPEADQLYYPEDFVSDFPLKLNIAEIVREKFLGFLKEELPYSVAVLTDEVEERENLFFIQVTILVERESQKEIVIGKGGANLKTVGILARREIEELLGKKVFLELKVKIERDWQNNPYLLKRLGYFIRD
ncbi:MAG: GTPase Era, partial [Candidatus Omnitrophica bacterium]|nr:GTPase Era [Candidatus Omnitrophota bacterium]